MRAIVANPIHFSLKVTDGNYFNNFNDEINMLCYR